MDDVVGRLEMLERWERWNLEFKWGFGSRELSCKKGARPWCWLFELIYDVEMWVRKIDVRNVGCWHSLCD